MVPGFDHGDEHGVGQLAVHLDGLRRVDLGLAADLVAQVVVDDRRDRVRAAVLRDLVVREVHSASARCVGGLRVVSGPDRLLGRGRVVGRVDEGQAHDLVHLRRVLYHRKLQRGEDAVGTDFAAVVQHQVGGPGRLLRKDLHVVPLELRQVFRGVVIGQQVGKAPRIGPADVCQAVVFRVAFRDVDFLVGSQPRVKQRGVSRRRDDEFSTVVETRNLSVGVLGVDGVVVRERLSILGEGETDGGEQTVQQAEQEKGQGSP